MDHNLPQAARDLRTRIEQQVDAYRRMSRGSPTSNVHASLPAELTGVFLAGIEDLADRVTLIERTQRRLFDRLDFLMHIGRLLGHEDWSDLTVDDSPPGALVTAAQADALGASGPASSPPASSPASVP